MKTLFLVGLLLAGDLRLIDAVKNNDTAAVRALIAQRVDVNATEVDGSTALHWAAQRDNPEIVDLLLAAGANPKAANRYKVTPLFLAATNGSDDNHRAAARSRRRPERHVRGRRDGADDRVAHRKNRGPQSAARRGASVNAAEPVQGQTP